MIRRRFVASVVAGLAGLFGAKAARGERVVLSTAEARPPVVYEGLAVLDAENEPPGYRVRMRISDGRVLREDEVSIKKIHPHLIKLGTIVRVYEKQDAIIAFSGTSLAHARELAEAARLRYVIGSAMKVTPVTIFDAPGRSVPTCAGLKLRSDYDPAAGVTSLMDI